ncbi:hypothetical protein B7494_g6848 [Chlorociboria aeruginascens]|nr:hypothetical protein B7494_g6848 [Chlorociboria aeruginascens]
MTLKSHIVYFCSVALFINKSLSAAVIPYNSEIQLSSEQQVLSPPLQEAEVDTSYNESISTDKRPIYAIAHRVLMIQSVRDAVSDGANALEIDVTAWSDQWYADHNDHAGASKGDTVENMFREIARQRYNGKVISFVWLDIKNPKYCEPDDPSWKDKCSVVALRKLAKDILEPKDIRVLYGFDSSDYKAYDYIRKNLRGWEAIGLDGKSDDVVKQFEDKGPSDTTRRVMSRGLAFPDAPFVFGDCDKGDSGICGQLYKAASSNKFGKVFGWTTRASLRHYVKDMLDVGSDGVIYGFPAHMYASSPKTQSALADIKHWVMEHSSNYRMAGWYDYPW